MFVVFVFVQGVKCKFGVYKLALELGFHYSSFISLSTNTQFSLIVGCIGFLGFHSFWVYC